MYRVMVADDEEIIVNGLVRTMPWEKYGCRVVATALDGTSALAALRREKPDILFTDIRMPGTDGLAVIAAVRSEYPAMQVTILSGYPNFEYAQRAIELGVSGYVLKPSRFAQLEEALARMTQTLDARRAAAAAAGGAEKSAQTTAAAKNGTAANGAAAGGAATNGMAAAVRTAAGAETAGGTAAAAAPPADGGAPAPITVPENGAAQNFIVKNAVAYIRAHYAERLTLSEVADHVYVSQWHLSKLISRCTGESFFDLLNTVRIEKAKELLADPALRVWEVSENVGFTDATHFSRTFKRLTGMSANEYRSRC